MTEPAVTIERRSGAAWIVLNRPQAMNAINAEVRELLPRALASADADPQVSVIVLRGAGDRAFCGGADIKEFQAMESPIAYRQARAHDHWVLAFDRCRKPIIAAVQGYCLGGGFEIALACDIRMVAIDATLGFPETGLGVMTTGGPQRLVRIAGLGCALDLVISGQRISGEEAHRLGIATRKCAPGTVFDEAQRLADQIAAKAPLSTVFAKEAVRQGSELPLADGLKLEVDMLTHLLNTEDRLEAAAAFKEKRAPVFKGR